ncbi:MAG: prepilin peptidase [Corynebacterium sp.]|uniref:prepilin peptidase n=1 Tax=Corynebacterium sp. TaxID=1720 RepID=UPI003F9650CF
MLGGAVVLVWALALAVWDFRHRRLPDILTLPAVPVVWAAAIVTGHGWAVLGGLGWFLVCVLPGLVSARMRVGGGDAKLALSLGAVALGTGGVAGLLLAVGGASLVTLVIAGVTGRGGGVPHGPGMLLATGTVAVIHLINAGGW